MRSAALAILLTLVAGMPAALAESPPATPAPGERSVADALDRLLSRDDGLPASDEGVGDDGPIDCMLRLPSDRMPA